MMNYLYAGDILQYLSSTGGWILKLAVAVVGIGLIIAAVIDLYAGLGHSNKDMKKAGIGLAVGLLGGLLLVWGAEGITGFFRDQGNTIPH